MKQPAATIDPVPLLIDSHCHLDLPPLADILPEVLQRADSAGVRRFICPGVAPDRWSGIRAVAAKYPAILPAFGIHPQQADEASLALLAGITDYLPNAAAIGETGLDYTDKAADRDLQQELFRRQLSLAAEHRLPVIIHCRAAFADLLRLLDEASPLAGGVMHAFSGSIETAREAIARGFLIGVAGPVTWENARKPVELVRTLPLASLLLETDAPDLTPSPHQGICNEPAFLPLIAASVARIKGIGADEVARATTANAEELFYGKTALLFPH